MMTVDRLMELCMYYNNLDLEALKVMDNLGLTVVATDKKCKELGIEIKGDSFEIDIPVYSVKYMLPSGKCLKSDEVGIDALMEMKKRGLVIELRKVSRYKKVAVYDIGGYNTSRFRLEVDAPSDEITAVVEALAQFECKDTTDNKKVCKIVLDNILGNAVSYGEVVDDNMMKCIISVVYRVSSIIGQEYILDISNECYDEIISELLDDMEANYIRSLTGM